ncbi:MAG: peptidoglycan-binding protein [Clostridiales bacterium]|nr:peptidoglycan-binding protein [Clostridiales bacterium]
MKKISIFGILLALALCLCSSGLADIEPVSDEGTQAAAMEPGDGGSQGGSPLVELIVPEEKPVLPVAPMEPQTQVTPVEPVTQSAPTESQMQIMSVEPVTQATPMEFQTQDAPTEPVTQAAPMEFQTQDAPVEPVTQSAPTESQMQIMSVEPVTQVTPVEPPAQTALEGSVTLITPTDDGTSTTPTDTGAPTTTTPTDTGMATTPTDTGVPATTPADDGTGTTPTDTGAPTTTTPTNVTMPTDSEATTTPTNDGTSTTPADSGAPTTTTPLNDGTSTITPTDVTTLTDTGATTTTPSDTGAPTTTTPTDTGMATTPTDTGAPATTPVDDGTGTTPTDTGATTATTETTAPEIPVEPEAAAPKLMNFVTKDIVKKGGKGSISGSVAVASGHTVVVELSGSLIPTISTELTEYSNTFKFDNLNAGEYTITIYDKANPSLKLTLKQTVKEGAPDVPTTPITGLAAKAEPNKIIVTGKAEPNRAVVVGTILATQEVTVVSKADGIFTAVLTCAAGTYKVWAEYANLKDTRVEMAGSVKVEDEKIDHYPTFQRGDRYHPLIFRLQQRLRELGYYSIRVDGVYGSGTERAVRLFQQINGIHPANGVATNHTQQVLYSASAKPFHGLTPMPYPGGGTLYRSPYYQPAVVPLQQRLRTLGYYTGSADGYFGSGTERAVRNFQKRNGLPATGAADPATQMRLYSASAIPAGHGGGGYVPSTGYRLLYWGCRGDAVRRLQQALRNAGYTQVRTVDGIYGKWTYDAVRAFQRDHGLSVDGIAGRKTQNALYGTHY